MPDAAYRVRFANGQVSLCQSLDEAHWVLERMDDSPAEGILPAEIAKIDPTADGGLRLIERHSPP
jgi:hypothetical protein